MLMSVVVLDIACLAAAHLSLSRRAASSRLTLAAAPSDWTAYRVVSIFVALTALAAAAALCVLAVELPHNFALERVNARTVFVEWELLYAALVGLYFLGQRHAVLPSLVPVASMGIGVAEHFVFLFKGQPIQPGDMLAIGTAAAVSDGYVYTLSAQCLRGLTCDRANTPKSKRVRSVPAGAHRRRGGAACVRRVGALPPPARALQRRVLLACPQERGRPRERDRRGGRARVHRVERDRRGLLLLVRHHHQLLVHRGELLDPGLHPHLHRRLPAHAADEARGLQRERGRSPSFQL